MKKIIYLLLIIVLFISGCSKQPLQSTSLAPEITNTPKAITIDKTTMQPLVEIDANFIGIQSIEDSKIIPLSGGYLLVFSSFKNSEVDGMDFNIIKIDASGNLVQHDIYENYLSSNYYFTIVANEINIFGIEDKWQLVYDLDGNYIKEKKFSFEDDIPYSSLYTEDGAFVLTKCPEGGDYGQPASCYKMCKFSLDGDKEWDAVIKADIPENEAIRYVRIMQSEEGNIILYFYRLKNKNLVVATYETNGYFINSVVLKDDYVNAKKVMENSNYIYFEDYSSFNQTNKIPQYVFNVVTNEYQLIFEEKQEFISNETIQFSFHNNIYFFNALTPSGLNAVYIYDLINESTQGYTILGKYQDYFVFEKELYIVTLTVQDELLRIYKLS